MPPKQATFTFRLDADLAARFDARVRETTAHGELLGRRGGDHQGRAIGRSVVLERLVELYAQGRLVALPEAGSNPFPADEVPFGSTPENPILITRPTWLGRDFDDCDPDGVPASGLAPSTGDEER